MKNSIFILLILSFITSKLSAQSDSVINHKSKINTGIIGGYSTRSLFYDDINLTLQENPNPAFRFFLTYERKLNKKFFSSIDFSIGNILNNYFEVEVYKSFTVHPTLGIIPDSIYALRTIDRIRVSQLSTSLGYKWFTKKKFSFNSQLGVTFNYVINTKVIRKDNNEVISTRLDNQRTKNLINFGVNFKNQLNYTLKNNYDLHFGLLMSFIFIENDANVTLNGNYLYSGIGYKF